jgi:hypothetical protein
VNDARERERTNTRVKDRKHGKRNSKGAVVDFQPGRLHGFTHSLQPNDWIVMPQQLPRGPVPVHVSSYRSAIQQHRTVNVSGSFEVTAMAQSV